MQEDTTAITTLNPSVAEMIKTATAKKPAPTIKLKKLKDVVPAVPKTPKPKETKTKPDSLTPASQLALCRNIAGGDLMAGVLLYRIIGLWKRRPKKLVRFGVEWIAMSREDWARSAGLSLYELRDRALPRLRKSCAFVTIRTMKVKPNSPNEIWISVDMTGWDEAVTPWDLYEPALNGQGVGYDQKPYPYKA